jgi:hypothetical protein
MTHEASRTPAPALTPRLPEGLTCRIIGLGGIGQIVAVHLTRFLCSVPRAATVMLIDGDDFEHGNETRMLVPDYYRNKAESLQAELAGQCASSEVTMVAVPEYVSPDNIDRLVPSGSGEFVLLCVDNHATRNLVGTHACGLDDICVISGGNDGVGRDGSGTMRHGTAGNVQIHIRAAGSCWRRCRRSSLPTCARPRACSAPGGSTPARSWTTANSSSTSAGAEWLRSCRCRSRRADRKDPLLRKGEGPEPRCLNRECLWENPSVVGLPAGRRPWFPGHGLPGITPPHNAR